MKLADPAQLTLKGEFQDRIARSIRHLIDLNTDEMRKEFTSPTDFWHWGADYMGRWISAMSLLGQYTGESYGVDAVVHELLGFQNRDGSFGPYTDPHDFQEWFGMSRGLVGLLEYYQTSQDERALAAAVRLGDFYLANYPDWAPCLYECYSTALEGLVLLFKLTGEAKYLETARRIATSSAVYKGVRYSKELTPEGRRSPVSGQVHCQLTTARGLLDLYEVTQEKSYLTPVLELHNYIMKELLWVSGGIGFYYYRPEENETCADSDWLRMNLQLWRLTRDVRFMHLAEHILLNQIFFNQADNGGFCYLRGLQNRAGAVFDACCSHHAPRAFYEVLRHIYATTEEVVWINLLMGGAARLALENGTLALSSDIQEDSGAQVYSLTLTGAPLTPLRLMLRIPEWAGPASLVLNGQAVPLNIESGYIRLERIWRRGDRLVATFPMTVRVKRGHVLGQHVIFPDEVAVFYGPRLFSLDDTLNPDVRLHLVRLKLPSSLPDGFRVAGSNRLLAMGVTPDRASEPLIFAPLSEIGGTPSGLGRIHTIRSPYYKVWIPLEVDIPLPS